MAIISIINLIGSAESIHDYVRTFFKYLCASVVGNKGGIINCFHPGGISKEFVFPHCLQWIAIIKFQIFQSLNLRRLIKPPQSIEKMTATLCKQEIFGMLQFVQYRLRFLHWQKTFS